MRPSCRSTVPWSQEMCSWYNLSPRMFTTETAGTRRGRFVGGMPGILLVLVGSQGDRRGGVKKLRDSQPVYFLGVGERGDELIYHAVDPHCPAHQLQRHVVWVPEDEMVPVEVRQPLTADPARHLATSVSYAVTPPYHHVGISAKGRSRGRVLTVGI